MDFDLDFSQLSLLHEGDGITPTEIASVLSNEKSRLIEIDGYPQDEFYAIETGYSIKKRVLWVATRILNDKRQVLQAKVADEDELTEYYCKG